MIEIVPQKGRESESSVIPYYKVNLQGNHTLGGGVDTGGNLGVTRSHTKS